MIPTPYFIVLTSIILLLLYVTRTSEENLVMMGRSRVRKLQFWIKNRRK